MFGVHNRRIASRFLPHSASPTLCGAVAFLLESIGPNPHTAVRPRARDSETGVPRIRAQSGNVKATWTAQRKSQFKGSVGGCSEESLSLVLK
jgi:hypothetical protein